MNIIAYIIWGKDGGYYFENAPASVFCPVCGSVIDKHYTPNSLEFNKGGYDVSYTYDGPLIVSQKFKDFFDRHDFQEAKFLLVDKKQKLYLFEPIRMLEFDAKRRKTRFVDFCEKCNQYESIAGAAPAFLRNVPSTLKKGFYRTDIEFGSGRAKSPLIIIGVETYKQLKKEKLKGLEFEPISN